jgi:hypothetical protein
VYVHVGVGRPLFRHFLHVNKQEVSCRTPGLPDGIFSNQKSKFWSVLLSKVLMYFMDIWSILLSIVTFYGHLVYLVVIWYIFPVLVFCTKKNLATLPHSCELHKKSYLAQLAPESA